MLSEERHVSCVSFVSSLRNSQDDTMAESRHHIDSSHGRRHETAELFAEDHRRLYLSRRPLCRLPEPLARVGDPRRRTIVSTPPDREAKEQLVVIQSGCLWATVSLSNHVSPRLGRQHGALRQETEATATGAQRGRSFTTDRMRRQQEASHVSC